MLAMSLRLIHARADHLRQADHKWNVARTLKKAVRNSLREDKSFREEAAMEEIGEFLETPKGTTSDPQGAYSILKRWYQHESRIQPHHSCTDFDHMSGEYAALYQREDPPPP